MSFGEVIEMKKNFQTCFLLTAILVLMFPAIGPAQAASKAQDVRFWLTVLHNNEGESDLVNLGAGLEDFGGVARFKTVVDNLMSKATKGPRPDDQRGGKRGVIMLSSGDNISAGPVFNVSQDRGVPYYDTIALDLIGYDAVTIGNHDFDFGPDVLADFIEGYTLWVANSYSCSNRSLKKSVAV